MKGFIWVHTMSSRVDIEKTDFNGIRFPDICPVCGLDNPDSKLSFRTFFSANQPLNETLGAHWNLAVPVCQRHKKNITLGRWVSSIIFFLLMGLLALGVVYFLPYLDILGWFFGGLILLFLMGLGIYLNNKIYVPPLMIESFSTRLMFTFRNDVLAEKFAKLNGINQIYSCMNQSRLIDQESSQKID